ncbi:peroxiredoxin family protein [Rummeliibacillus suwonensis]|uniref:peroxiredoxin family protein n=1 Tax=Rummeliibacillus suwonensis TaxID=1306154 RepID=UPI001AAF9B4B|nr:TlpA disulfide reductase family protein [Rummeliibacillus suwonensis]MBO2534297.1 TlpA family protein disulfide reductase [Rummeliibacillus suwonensis]
MKKKIFGLLLIFALIAIVLTNFVRSKMAEGEKIDTSSTQVSAEVNNKIKSGIEVNQMAPDFSLKTLDGKEAKLSDYRGQKVILNFWATWCPPCKAEIPHMEKYYKNHAKKDHVEILAVNLTKSDKDENYIKDFIKSYDMTYPVLLDTEGEQQKQYEIVTIPTTFIIDTKGVIQKKIVGPMDQNMMIKTIASIK